VTQVVSVVSATNGAINKFATDVVAGVIITTAIATTAIVAAAILRVAHDNICVIRLGIGILRFSSLRP